MKNYDVARFLSNTERDHQTGCLVWTGSVCPRGYGKYSMTTAQRVAHMIWIGPIPEGFEVDHLCGNPPCVEPSHLEAVTPAENMRRRVARRTHCRNNHPYTPENTYLGSGYRVCRTCQRESTARYNARKRQSA